MLLSKGLPCTCLGHGGDQGRRAGSVVKPIVSSSVMSTAALQHIFHDSPHIDKPIQTISDSIELNLLLLQRRGPKGTDKSQNLHDQPFHCRMEARHSEHLTYQAWSDIDNVLGYQKDQRVQFTCNRDCQFRCTSVSDLFSSHRHNGCTEKLTILPLALIIIPLLHQPIIHITRLDSIQQIQEKHRIAQTGILETPHRTALAALLDFIVCPSDHILVRDALAAFTDTRQRLVDRQTHQLPYETENERFGAVDNVGALDTDHVHPVGFGEIDGIICIFDGFETGEFLALFGLGDPSPDDAAGDDFVESLEQDRAVLYCQLACA